MVHLFLLLFCNYFILVFNVCQAIEIFACYEQSKYLSSARQNVILVDATEGTLVHLYCNYCDVKARKNKTIVWSYRRRGNIKTKHLILNSNANSKYSISYPTFTLNIKNFSRNDSGIYTCQNVKRDKDLFQFVTDSVVVSNLKANIGSVKQSKKMEQYQIGRINGIFNKSYDEPFKSLRDRYKLLFQVFISWGRWELCKPKPYSHRDRDGLRRKIGKCRLHSISLENDRKVKKSISSANITSYYLKDNYDVSCHSIDFNETFPLISRILKQIPDYEVTESCVLKENVGNTKAAAAASFDDETLKTLVQIAENGHTTLTCAEGETGSKVDWFKDNNLLNDSYRNNMADQKEPHLTIDVYNTLYVLCATKHEEANYHCTMNGIKIREYTVKVVSMAKILNQDFIRYSMYLGFILSLTVTCYCAGLCVAWRRRASFADPLNFQYNFKEKIINTKQN